MKKKFSQIQQLDIIDLTTKIRSASHIKQRNSLKLYNFYMNMLDTILPQPDNDCSRNGSGQNLRSTNRATLSHIAEQIAASNELTSDI